MTPEELASDWEAEAAMRDHDDAVAVRLRSCAALLRSTSPRGPWEAAGSVLRFAVGCALAAFIIYLLATVWL